MTRKISVVMLMIVAGVLMVSADVAADSRMERAQNGAARRAIADHTTAVAALEPVGGAEGWGRVMVKDMALSDGGMRRVAAIHLLGLVPDATYTVVVDDVTLAEVAADANGDAQVKLSSDDEDLPPVPEDLPLAGELLLATVVDASGAPTLEGAFDSRSYGFAGPQDLVYYDRIHLEAMDDFTNRGIARVSRDGDDVQSFETRACGLETGEMYEIRIDGLAAGQVTADSVGQAALELSTADVDNPLATGALGAIEDYVLVEWVWLSQSTGDTVVLAGYFTGENRVGAGQSRDRQGDGDGEYGDGDNGSHGDNDNGSGDGSGEGGPHGDGDCDGSGEGDCDGSGEGGPHGDNGSGDGDGEGGPHGDGDCDGSGEGGADGECDGSGPNGNTDNDDS